MAIITTDLQLVSANSTADALTGYTAIGATANVADSDAKVHNTACIRNNNISASIFPVNSGTALNAFTAINLTNKALYLWRSNAMPTNLAVKNQYAGCTFWVSSGATYNTSPYKAFDLDGQDTDLTGGWKSYAVDPTRSTALLAGSLNTAAVTSLGFSRAMLTTLTNAGLDYIDVTRYGTGLKVKDNSAVSGQQANFSEIFTYDSDITRSWGVLTSIGGVYYGMGKLLIGGDDAVYPTTTDNQAQLTYFKDTEQTLVWKSMPLGSDFYEIRVAANATQDTIFQLGSYNATTEVATEGVTVKGSIDTGAVASAQQSPGSLTAQSMFVTAGTRLGAGQSFRNLVIGSKLKEVSFWMAKTGTPTSTLTAKLYAHSGTFGTSSIPTGAALATSDPISASVVSTTQGWIKFTFSGAQQYTMADNTDYVIAVEISGATSNSTNFVAVYSNASNTYPGNWASWSGSAWTATATTDIAFKLYTINPASTWKFTATNTNSNNIIKLYGSTFENIISSTLNGNTRSRTVALCGLTNTSATVTTSNNFTTGFIVPGMVVSGTGIPADTRVASIESNTSLTLTNAATTTDTVTLTFTDRSEIISCSFNGIGAITPNGCYIHDTIFENVVTTAPTSATNALVVSSTSHIANISSCQFINCNRAIRITAPGTYVFDNLIFSGNTYDIENTSSGLVTITLLNGSNATTFINTGGGTTVINTPRTLSVTNIIDGSAVRIIKQSDMSILAEADIVGVSPSGLTGITVISDPLNAGRYVAKYEYNYTANTPVFVVVTNNNYQVIYTTSELVNDDSSLQISQVIDRQYTNPA
jgi:hypothetical protein